MFLLGTGTRSAGTEMGGGPVFCHPHRDTEEAGLSECTVCPLAPEDNFFYFFYTSLFFLKLYGILSPATKCFWIKVIHTTKLFSKKLYQFTLSSEVSKGAKPKYNHSGNICQCNKRIFILCISLIASSLVY